MEFIKQNKIMTIVIVIIVASIAYNFLRDKTPEIDFVTVERGQVIEEVSVTGKVKPVESVELAFEQAGRISSLSVDVGDRVLVGQKLANLSSGNVLAQLRQAEASLLSKEAKLAELKAGTRPEEIAVQEVKVANAEVALNDAKHNIVDKIADAFSKSDDAVRNRIDQFISSPSGGSPQLEFNTANEAKIEQSRVIVGDALAKWQGSLANLSSSSDLPFYINEAEENMSLIGDFIIEVSLAVNGLKASDSLSQTKIDGWRTDISTARTNVSTANINLSTAEEKLNIALSALTLAEQELALDKSGSTPETIQAGIADVAEARASVDRYQAELTKTVIRSPINGVVVKVDSEEGEIVSVNDIIISIISASAFEIETFIPEADIARVTIGDSAKVTLDAYSSDVLFQAIVVSIDPAETVIEGVSTYKTILQFAEKDDRVRSGMTANIDILTDRRDNVIYVPRKAILANESGEDIVRIVNGDKSVYEEIIITTGLIGSDGNAEVLSGVSEGDEVITYIEE